MNLSRFKKAPPKSARAAALLTLLDVESGRFPEDGLDEYAGRLDRRDRALASALVYGVLRWKSRLDWTLRRFLAKPDKSLHPAVRLILLLGLFQLQYLNRIPASAAVNESVNLAKTYGPTWSPKMVNGVLRNMVRADRLPDPASADLPAPDRLALEYAHPAWLARRWVDQLGAEAAAALMAANNVVPPLTLRVHTSRTNRDDVAARLMGSAEEITPARYSPDGLILRGAVGPVADLPGYADGWFSIQDEAAQIVGWLARPRPGETVLDACAGRGGKTMHLAAMADGPVWGLDPDANRLNQARSEADRLGLNPVRLVQGDLLEGPPFEPESFDVVLVDAPCSNLGVIRRRPDVKWLKSSPDPARLADTQLRLLKAAATLVKPRGRLIYAVCTVTPEETTGVTDAFWMDHLDFGLRPAGGYLPESARPLVDPDGMVRAWPHRHGTDGFFAALFEKKDLKPADHTPSFGA